MVLTKCDAAYPNSQWEAEGLRRAARGGDPTSCHVVPNAVDPGLLHRGESGAQFRERWHVETERFVLSVARFDERKNNLRLIIAAQQAGLPCILIGRPAPLHQGLFARCQALAAEGDLVRIIEAELSQEELVGAYRAAWVHALPSWLETPGLVNLEAGLCGANLVVGDCPSVREYFMDRAWYCNPGQVGIISTALREAMTAPRNAHRLDEYIADNFAWSKVATLQLELYERAITRWRSRNTVTGERM
jgi:glycosyltransferase involved in cell wall biosynthesis